MSDLAIPGYAGGAPQFREYPSGETAGNELKRGELVVISSNKVIRTTTPFAIRPIGIVEKDERNQKAVVYIGGAGLAMPGATANTLAIGDDVYPQSAIDVEGEPEAVATAKAIGKVVEIIGTKILFEPFFAQDEAGADAA